MVMGYLAPMNSIRKTIKIFGFDVNVTEIPVAKPADEKFTEYELEDGTVLKVKHVLTSVVQVDGQTLPDGTPVYLVSSTPVVSVIKRPHQLDGRDGEKGN